MKVVNEMKLSFPGKSCNESFARAAVACFAAQLDPTVADLGDLKTSVSEAVTNAIVHAYPSSVGWVWITAKIYEDGSLEVIVRDRGRGIPDVAQAMEPLFTTGGDDRSGMGFTIMSTFMDSLRVRSRPGVGTVVKMTRKMSAREEG